MKCKQSLEFINAALVNDKCQSRISSPDNVNSSAEPNSGNEQPLSCTTEPDNSLVSDERPQIGECYDSFVVDDTLDQTVSSYFISDNDPNIESNFAVWGSTLASRQSNVSAEKIENPSQAVDNENVKSKTEFPVCDAVDADVDKHMDTHKDNAEQRKPYVCELCQRSYINRPSYIGHINKHNNIRPYSCSKCDKTFHGAANLRMHMNSHETVRRFRCSDCSKTFRYCHDLATHRRIHTQNPIYACEHCNYTNVKLQYLKRHALIHNSEHRFTCENCAKGFNRKEYYRKHMQTNRCKRDEALLPT